jgi:hypothetical protein
MGGPVATLADVRRWNPSAVETAFRGLGAVRDRLVDADTDLVAATPPAGWTGVAADGAGREHGRIAEQLRRTVAGVSALRPALAGAADTITDLHRELDLVDGLAAARGYRINPDGSVVPPPAAAGLSALTAQLQAAELAEITLSLADVLRRAEELDTTLTAALLAVASGQIDDGTGDSLRGAAEHALGPQRPPLAPPAGATPEQNAAWWAGLSPVQREVITLTDPDLIGNRDGIPAPARDEANRARLDAETDRTDALIAATRARIAELPPRSPGAIADPVDDVRHQLEDHLADLQDQRDALTAVDDTIDADPGGRQLLLLDVDGHAEPRAAVAIGDIETADHVAVYTPGFTTTVTDSLPGVANDLSRLRGEAESQLDHAHQIGEPSATVATVAWLGYDIPQWDTSLDPDQSVASPLAAQAGGADLARFLDGVGAARPGDDPHLTALGHSYGSTTTGYALQHAGTGVDDAVLFGSPGTSVHDPTRLDVPAGHLSLLEARDDAVADLGAFGGDPTPEPGLTHLSTHAEVVDGQRLAESVGHSDYLTQGSTSQYNIAATVAGLPQNRVGTDRDWGLGDIIRGPLP